MSLWHIAWSYLWNRKVTTSLTILSVALAVGLITTVLTLRQETQRRFEEEGQMFDLVIGAKGNPLQLVLSSVYFLNQPVGNIRYDDFVKVSQEEEVKAAFPISMGDNYQGYRIIGTSADLINFDWEKETGRPRMFRVVKGRNFEKPMEAVLGSIVADNIGKGIGERFVGSHGLVAGSGHEHEHNPYTIVGILDFSGTPNDRAIFCSTESVWQIHAHGDEEGHGEGGHAEDHEEHGEHEGHAEDCEVCEHAHDDDPELTAGVLLLQSPALRFTFKEYVNNNYNVMAVVPIDQIRQLFDQLLGTAKAVLLAIGYLVVVISALSILIGLYMAIIQRRKDLAIMRALGASSGEIFGAVLIEAFWVTVLGMAAGYILSGGVAAMLSYYLKDVIGFAVPAFAVSPDLVTSYSTVLLMGMLAGILPAWQAYRVDVARNLAEL